ncbi:MAG: hypothetical protein Q8N18_26270 [Opitutaceae bacterium]|nr:hypothetical protein [Opitutaceae bacterium]
MRRLAKDLMATEGSGDESSETKSQAAFRVCEKLRPHLATLMGNSGYWAHLSRALALAKAEVPWLRTVRVKADGAFEGLEELQAQVGADVFFEGGVVLVAQVLGLLVAFVGEDLTLRMVRDAWPKPPR